MSASHSTKRKISTVLLKSDYCLSDADVAVEDDAEACKDGGCTVIIIGEFSHSAGTMLFHVSSDEAFPEFSTC
ncbi:MAG: hypothetical protein J5965_01040 [Aeriscardovia sp.]|nr:hypothetical protein [Aeriscardovia sp.]